jgi:hypothetical protein
MEKLIKIENIEFGLKCSAGTVRAYRMEYGRDLILDIAQLQKEMFETKEVSAESAQFAENVVYTMAKEYDPDIVPISEWLDQFSPYFVYQAVPQVIVMWLENTRTLNEPKKKAVRRKGNGQALSSSSGQHNSD